MNILFVGAEAVPFAKKGGLADVMGSLPPKLREMEIDARVIIPYYGAITSGEGSPEWTFSFQFARPTGTTDVHVYKAMYEDVTYYLVRAWPFFGEEAPGVVYTDWVRDVPRYLFFNQVTMAVAWELRGREGWFPDIFHVNDWHTALIPFLLDISRADPIWREVGAVLSIHNAGEEYQGQSVGGWLWQVGIPGRGNPALLQNGLTDNMLAIGTAYSDAIIPVSPRYAVEIHYPYTSGRMSALIAARTADVHGILNGIDVGYWNPETDTMIAAPYDAENFVEERPANKRQLQEELGLTVRDDVPIVGVVTRLVRQKGFDLAVDPLFQLVVENKIQFVLVGSGDPILDIRFADLARAFPERVTVEQGYNEPLAHRVYAGCDIFIMPSHYEPCGIGQMIAMRYGALPLVRETGGLADTVQNYDNDTAEQGTGFVFQWEQPQAVLGTLRWAVDTFQNKRDAWQRMQKRGMDTDFSWDKSAQEYINLYKQVIAKRRGSDRIEVDIWNPETDSMIVSNYNAKNFVEKRPANKRQLQEAFGLTMRDDVPIVGAVTRLAKQKGFDLAINPLFQLVLENKIQFVLLTSSAPQWDFGFANLARTFPERVTFVEGFNALLAHQIYAGCDIFIMPSYYEPNGINQIIAMRYGALPLVRETGRLAETVQNYDNDTAEQGTGFVFQEENAEAVLKTLRWAVDTFHNKKEAWQRMQKRGMETDFS